MSWKSAALLSISLCTLHQAGLVAAAQTNDQPNDTVEDYADDPSYQAARRLLEVFAGAANNRADDDQRAQDEPLSSDPWPAGSEIKSWAHHYFIFQGENYFPVQASYVTPYVTLFALEDGYTPTGEENINCRDDSKSESVVDGINDAAEALTAADGALAGDAAGALGDARRYGCPNTLGEIWGSGSQVMDKDHNVLAEQWFPDGSKAIVSHDWPWQDDDRFEDDGPTDFLVVFGGGPDRLGDPAIHPLPVPTMIVVDYPVLRPEGDEDGGFKQDDGKPKKPYIPGAPDLPVTVFGEVPSSDDWTTVTPYQNPIDVISGRVKEAATEIIDKRQGSIEFLLMHRGDPQLSEAPALERLRIIRETLGDYGDVKTISLGQEMPICRSDDDRCWSINRSTILYAIDR